MICANNMCVLSSFRSKEKISYSFDKKPVFVEWVTILKKTSNVALDIIGMQRPSYYFILFFFGTYNTTAHSTFQIPTHATRKNSVQLDKMYLNIFFLSKDYGSANGLGSVESLYDLQPNSNGICDYLLGWIMSAMWKLSTSLIDIDVVFISFNVCNMCHFCSCRVKVCKLRHQSLRS